jgi:hypothetical protein
MYKSILIGLLFIYSSTVISQELYYPSAYTSLNLPEYPNATITELGRTSESLKDGVKIFLESSDDYITLRSYYESEMAALGWTLQESIAVKKMREMGKLDMIPFAGVFKKDDLVFQIFTSRVNDLTKLNIALLKK